MCIYSWLKYLSESPDHLCICCGCGVVRVALALTCDLFDVRFCWPLNEQVFGCQFSLVTTLGPSSFGLVGLNTQTSILSIFIYFIPPARFGHPSHHSLYKSVFQHRVPHLQLQHTHAHSARPCLSEPAKQMTTLALVNMFKDPTF